MALTTHEKIRVESGFQARNIRQAFKNEPGSGATTFFVKSDLNYRLVPDFNTGTTIAGISDVQVYVGLSGINGSSRMTIASVDPEQGAVSLTVAPGSGASLTINYSSSAISSQDIENVRLRAESTVNQRLGICYDLPLSPIPSSVTDLATRLAAAFLLIKGYGTGSINTAADGYALYGQIMGRNEMSTSAFSEQGEILQVGELGLICTPSSILIDDDGNVIPRNDDDSASTGEGYTVGGNKRGRLFVIQDEEVRFKEPLSDSNKAGTIYNPMRRIQG